MLVVDCCFVVADCGSTTMLGVVGGIMAGEELMMSINCLLYLSGFICLLMVLALTTLLLMPSMFSFVELSLVKGQSRSDSLLLSPYHWAKLFRGVVAIVAVPMRFAVIC